MMRYSVLRARSPLVEREPTKSTRESSPPVDAIERCRRLLGDDAIGLSDEQIEAMSDHAITMAHIIIEMYLVDRSGHSMNAE
jgi:hypothetical protein